MSSYTVCNARDDKIEPQTEVRGEGMKKLEGEQGGVRRKRATMCACLLLCLGQREGECPCTSAEALQSTRRYSVTLRQPTTFRAYILDYELTTLILCGYALLTGAASNLLQWI